MAGTLTYSRSNSQDVSTINITGGWSSGSNYTLRYYGALSNGVIEKQTMSATSFKVSALECVYVELYKGTTLDASVYCPINVSGADGIPYLKTAQFRNSGVVVTFYPPRKSVGYYYFLFVDGAYAGATDLPQSGSGVMTATFPLVNQNILGVVGSCSISIASVEPDPTSSYTPTAFDGFSNKIIATTESTSIYSGRISALYADMFMEDNAIYWNSDSDSAALYFNSSKCVASNNIIVEQGTNLGVKPSYTLANSSILRETLNDYMFGES